MRLKQSNYSHFILIMMKKIFRITFIAVFAIALSVNGYTQETLKKIAERGELRVGMSANQPPFSMKA